MDEIIYHSQAKDFCKIFGFNCRKGRKLERLGDGDRLRPGDFYFTANGSQYTIVPGEFISETRITYYREVEK